MSTLLTVPAGRVWTEWRFTDADWRKVSRAVYSVDGYSPVRVAIYVGETVARINTVSLPGGAVWREPDAMTRRALLDEVLKPLGLKRVGRAEHRGGWHWHYNIEPIN